MEVLARQAGSADRGLPAGIVVVVDGDGTVRGIVTDGDIRRTVLEKGSFDIVAEDAMTTNPISFPEGSSFQEILRRLPDELESRHRRSRRFLGKILLVDACNRPVRILDYHQLWEQRVATHRHIVVIGLGYVGLTLALELAEEGLRVTGVDMDESKVQSLASGQSHVHELGINELLCEQLRGSFSVSVEIPSDGDVFIVAVGTPVKFIPGEKAATPQLDILKNAIGMLAERLNRGSLVILRSTVPIGCTRNVVLPLLEEKTGMTGGRDFHLAFAPERTAEGKALEELRSLPQLIGGLNEDSVEATVALFRELTPTIVRLESLEAVEMAKLINNSFRDLVFSFANRMSQIAAEFNLDVVEVIRSANRGYPRDTVPLPSPGVGGPCLTKDPYILASSTSQQLGTDLFEHGRLINESMHDMVADSVVEQLEALGKDPADCSVLVCGLAFKGHPETGDLRNSCSVEIADILKGAVKKVYGHDPVASAEDIAEFGIEPVGMPEGLDNMDAVMFLNNHPLYSKLNVFALVRVLKAPGIVYDGWHVFRPDEVLSVCPCVYMGLGMHRSSVGGYLGKRR